MKQAMRPSDSVNKVQLTIGLLFLVIGISIYALVRGNTLPFVPEALVVHVLFSSSITLVTHQLPTFTHLLAFTLFTAGLLGGGRRSAALICLFWLFIEIVFEVAQHPFVSGWLVYHIPQWFNNVWLLDNTRSFLSYSTFDPIDIVAAIFAALLAYMLIKLTQAKRIIFKTNTPQDVAMEFERSIP